MACGEQALSQSQRYFGQKTPTGLRPPLGESSLEDTRLVPEATQTLRDFPASLPAHTSGEAR